MRACRILRLRESGRDPAHTIGRSHVAFRQGESVGLSIGLFSKLHQTRPAPAASYASPPGSPPTTQGLALQARELLPAQDSSSVFTSSSPAFLSRSPGAPPTQSSGLNSPGRPAWTTCGAAALDRGRWEVRAP